MILSFAFRIRLAIGTSWRSATARDLGFRWPKAEAFGRSSRRTRSKLISAASEIRLSRKSRPNGSVEEVRFGGILPEADAELVPVPYYTYLRPGVADRPCIVSTSSGGVPLFVSATADWTQSGASELFPPRPFSDGRIAANGGSLYIPRTDGRRNDVYERFVWTVATDFVDALPAIPNPVSPWKHVTGTCASAKRVGPFYISFTIYA